MLDISDQIRLALKNQEFNLPQVVQRAAHTFGRVRSPYLPQDDNLKTIFIHVPKAAGTSVRRALYDTKSFHIPAIRYQISDSKRFADYYKFCFVRNPWDRMNSAFHYLHRRVGADPAFPDHRWATRFLEPVKSFEHLLGKMEKEERYRRQVRRYIHFRDQLDWISEPRTMGRKILIDHVGKFETLKEDYALISQKLNRKIELPHERRLSDGRDFRQAYTSSRMVDIVANIYSDDIEQFGYTFE